MRTTQRKEDFQHESATAAAGLWREVGAALEPVIGTDGFDALLLRAVRAVSASHEWLLSVRDAPQGERIAILAASLAAREPEQAAAAQRELQSTFAGLLKHLIGASLAHRLLRDGEKNFPGPGPGGTRGHH